MSHVSSPSSREVEREADDTRAQLSSTLEQLRDRLSPGQIVDELMQGSSANASKFVQNLGTSVRDHPVPALLIGAGLFMLMTGTGAGLTMSGSRDTSRVRSRSYGSGSDYRDYDERYGSDGDMGSAYERNSRNNGGDHAGIGEKIGSAASAAAEPLYKARDTITDLTGRATGAAADMAGSARAKARDMAGGISESLSGMGDTTSQYARGISDSASSYARAGRERMGSAVDMMADNPLLLGAVGLAIGAVLGAAIPSTDVENRLMGEEADRLKERAKDLAAEQLDHAKQVAGSAMREVQDAAGEQGVSLDSMEASAKDLGDKIAAVAERATETLKTEAHKTVDQAAEAAKSAMPSADSGKSDPASRPVTAGPGKGTPRTPPMPG